MKKGQTNVTATKSYKLGNSGENKVKLLLDTFNESQYNIHNIMLKDGDTTHQIDIICITNSGIFVIEVKNVCGYEIVCEKDMTYWHYDWIKNGKLINCKLYNPILQNRTHVQQIKKLFPNFPVYSMVVFSNNNILKHKNDLDEIVVNLKTIRSYIEKFPKNVLTDSQRDYIKSVIEKNNHKEISIN